MTIFTQSLCGSWPISFCKSNCSSFKSTIMFYTNIYLIFFKFKMTFMTNVFLVLFISSFSIRFSTFLWVNSFKYIYYIYIFIRFGTYTNPINHYTNMYTCFLKYFIFIFILFHESINILTYNRIVMLSNYFYSLVFFFLQ